MATKRQIRTARIYEDIGPDDGQRVLVDRIWPREESARTTHASESGAKT